MKHFNEANQKFDTARQNFVNNFNQQVEKVLDKIEEYVTSDNNYNVKDWKITISGSLSDDVKMAINAKLGDYSYPLVSFKDSYEGTHDTPCVVIDLNTIKGAFLKSAR